LFCCLPSVLAASAAGVCQACKDPRFKKKCQSLTAAASGCLSQEAAESLRRCAQSRAAGRAAQYRMWQSNRVVGPGYVVTILGNFKHVGSLPAARAWLLHNPVPMIQSLGREAVAVVPTGLVLVELWLTDAQVQCGTHVSGTLWRALPGRQVRVHDAGC
jgi:hypothetical protein